MRKLWPCFDNSSISARTPWQLCPHLFHLNYFLQVNALARQWVICLRPSTKYGTVWGLLFNTNKCEALDSAFPLTPIHITVHGSLLHTHTHHHSGTVCILKYDYLWLLTAQNQIQPLIPFCLNTPAFKDVCGCVFIAEWIPQSIVDTIPCTVFSVCVTPPDFSIHLWQMAPISVVGKK